MFKSEFLKEASERGFLYQSTNIDLLDEKLSNGPCTAYVGFDATADCLHVGHLLPIFFLRLFQKHGHKGIALFGGGTTKVGDPSFRNSMRPILTDEEINHNVDGIKKCLLNILNRNSYKYDIKFVNNADWLNGLKYLDFLRTVGAYFSVNKMIAFDSVKSRLTDNNSISFTEFNYMVMQAYDFLELHKKHDVDIQLGGQDQWGNIVCGVELIRKTLGDEVLGCTVPLLTKPDGTKMGKSLSGAVWIREDRLSPYEFWQYWRSIPDEMVGKCLRLFTDISIGEIERLETLKDSEINEAKKILADAVTEIIHGQAAVNDVHNSVDALFNNSEGADVRNVPSVSVNSDELGSISMVDVIMRYGVVNSRGEAKRLLRGGAVTVDNTTVDESYKITNDANGRKIVVGKKKAFLIRII